MGTSEGLDGVVGTSKGLDGVVGLVHMYHYFTCWCKRIWFSS